MKKKKKTTKTKEPVRGLAPFSFVGCVELQEMLGRRARDEQELLDHLEEVPADSIYFHTYSHFLRHGYIKGPYPNDFATWTAREVGDNVLGERLGVLSPFAFESVETLRSEIITIIDDHLQRLQVVPRVVYGEPFEFMSSRIIEIPTGIQVETFEDFVATLEEVDASVIYFHVFEAQLRMGKGQSDFALWLGISVGQGALAARLNKIDPYLLSLEELRAQILELCHQALEAKRT